MSRHRRPRHAATTIVVGTGLLVGLDLFAWVLWVAWHLAFILVPLAVIALGCRRWAWHRRAWAWLRARHQRVRPSPVQGQAVDERMERVVNDRAELDQLRGHVAEFESLTRRPFAVVISDYRRARARYGDPS